MTDENVPWYSRNGECNDVVLSSRVRLSRNLVNFDFLERISVENSIRVSSLVLDAISKFDICDKYRQISISNLDYSTLKMIIERGVFNEKAFILDEAQICVSSDGAVTPIINIDDHYRIVSFANGLNVSEAFARAAEIDSQIQDSVQVAFSLDFGYLNSSIKDCGSGMKVSVFLHLPGHTEAYKIKELQNSALSNGYFLKPFCGNFFFLQTMNSFEGSEITQIENFTKFVRDIVAAEHDFERQYFSERPSIARDMVFKAIAIYKFGKFLDFQDGMQIISAIKLGKSLGYLKGIEENEFLSLYFRGQNSHLNFLADSANIKFEKDLADKQLKIDRLRALIFQEAFSKLEITG